ncbi:glyoxylase-like metal-dependent hydrolase (beta-lactamase superfamily II) [Catenulispora sp. GAS73]|uniref:MBL fold metallo-hydrolase n=1 Tax=Catenulispora sp. GAS73 TaxID=3156269 RepID=UPI0035133D93
MSKEAAIRIAPNVWRIPAARFDFVNIYALVDDDGQVTLVDTGFKSGPAKAAAGLAAMGKTVGDVTRIVLTHAHSDHAGGAATLAEQANAPVAISAIDAPFARIGQAPPRDQSTFLGRRVGKLSAPGKDFPAIVIGEEFEEGDILPVAGGLRVHHTPGHTPGHVALMHESSGTLITGDSIWNVRKLGFGVKAFCTDIKLNRQTSHILGELEYQVAAFTHGPHVAEQAREKVRSFLRDAAKKK